MTATRRTFLAWSGAAGASLLVPARLRGQAHSPFKISVITDEISDDFDHACSVAATDFGMKWVELRSLWTKTVSDLAADDVAKAQAILTKYGLRVTDIAGPLFKVDWPDAPRSKFSAKNDSFNATANFQKQDTVLATCISLAKQFKTDKDSMLRLLGDWTTLLPIVPRWMTCYARPWRPAISSGIDLVIENEHECNTATASEAVRTLNAVPGLNLNWDPGNAVMAGETDAFPVGWKMLPKKRIHHCHCKNAAKDASGKMAWSPVGTGLIDWTAQFQALKAAHYHGAVSLETHWRGGGTAEASTRTSWTGMKVALAAARAL